MPESFIAGYFEEARRTIEAIDADAVERIAAELAAVRDRGGRLFVLGVGGSAANASHAVNDFRKLCGIEAYAPTDNVAELTARTNDEGWASTFKGWLEVSRLGERDAVLVFSVGGGDEARNVSPNLVRALKFAQARGSTILGIVGRDGGYTAQVADACAIVPVVSEQRVTPHAEAFQAVIWHGLVSHPLLQRRRGKWESVNP